MLGTLVSQFQASDVPRERPSRRRGDGGDGPSVPDDARSDDAHGGGAGSGDGDGHDLHGPEDVSSDGSAEAFVDGVRDEAGMSDPGCDPDDILASWREAAAEVGKEQRRRALRRIEEAGDAAGVAPARAVYTADNGFVYNRAHGIPLGRIRILARESNKPRAELKCLCTAHKNCSAWVNVFEVRSHAAMENWIAAAPDFLNETLHLKALGPMVMDFPTEAGEGI